MFLSASETTWAASECDCHNLYMVCAMQFVLDPLYKIFSCVIGEETKSIEKMLAQFKIKLKASTYGKDIKPLLTDVCTAVFGQASGLTEMLAVHIPSSKCAAPSKVEHLYLGSPVRSLNFVLDSQLPAVEWQSASSLSITVL